MSFSIAAYSVFVLCVLCNVCRLINDVMVAAQKSIFQCDAKKSLGNLVSVKHGLVTKFGFTCHFMKIYKLNSDVLPTE